MNVKHNIQNKVCSLNIDLNGTIITKVPILFRVQENSERTIEEIISNNIESIFNIIYKNAKTIDDLLFSNMYGIVYDILSEKDEYDTYELRINDMLDVEDNRFKKLIINKINKYSEILLNKMNIDTSASSFIETYDIINNDNENKISTTTFIQYILSCFNKTFYLTGKAKIPGILDYVN